TPAVAPVAAISPRTFLRFVLIVTPAVLPGVYGIVLYRLPTAFAANGITTVTVKVVVVEVILREAPPLDPLVYQTVPSSISGEDGSVSPVVPTTVNPFEEAVPTVRFSTVAFAADPTIKARSTASGFTITDCKYSTSPCVVL